MEQFRQQEFDAVTVMVNNSVKRSLPDGSTVAEERSEQVGKGF